MLVRFDARGTDEGEFYRIRLRALGGHDDGTHDDGTHDDGWTMIPDEGWAPITQLRVKLP